MAYDTLSQLIEFSQAGRVEIADTDFRLMELSYSTLSDALRAGREVYGVTSGFGPLYGFRANPDAERQGLGLICHLANGQGPPLNVDDTRLMILLRLSSMRRGFSGVSRAEWEAVRALYKAGFVPVVPSLGSLSASGDLTPLAHAALAMSGQGEAWVANGGGFSPEAASTVLDRSGLRPLAWTARSALAFVNGTSASLAIAISNHISLARLVRVGSMLTGAVGSLLGSTTDPYEMTVAKARSTTPGQTLVSSWILDEFDGRTASADARVLQEPYSLRCAPQILGAVADQLGTQAPLLLAEANGCSDNPVIAPDGIFHAGNFHAATVGLISDLHAILIHQVAFLAERQIALLIDPRFNGAENVLLAVRPGESSGVAGVQLTASSLTALIRQQCLPATSTALPTNFGNQDIVPMSLNAALARRVQVDSAWLVLGSLAVTINQYQHLTGRRHASSLFEYLRLLSPVIDTDRSMSSEVRSSAEALEKFSSGDPWVESLGGSR